MLPTLLETSQMICHWELYRMIQDVQGAIVECGVFQGRTLRRWAHFREISQESRQIIGFDTFDKFPEADTEDAEARLRFVERMGDKSLSVEEIKELLRKDGCDYGLTLLQGDICQTVPEFTKRNYLTIALLNLDVDLYKPTKVALEYLYPLLSEGGLLLCDDYGIFPGATRAIEEYCQKHHLALNTLKPLFRMYYLKKENLCLASI